VQEPPEHACPAKQPEPQAPQFSGSDWKFAQYAPEPVEQALGVAAGQAHWPLMHDCPPGHACAQAPQFFASLDRSAQ